MITDFTFVKRIKLLLYAQRTKNSLVHIKHKYIIIISLTLILE